MKIQVMFKCPDAVFNALQDSGLGYDERKKAEAFIKQFVKSGEHVRIEFNLDDKTATVIKPGS